MSTQLINSLAELRLKFAGQLTDRVAAIRSQFLLIKTGKWQTDEVENLHRLTHNLTGIAGTFGMDMISDAARVLENQLSEILKSGHVPEHSSWNDVGRALNRLESLSLIQLNSNSPNLKPLINLSLNHGHSPLIYLVEDDPEQARYLANLLRAEGYTVRIFIELDELRNIDSSFSSQPPAAIIMDMVFPESDTGGANAINDLRKNHPDLPPLIFVSIRDDQAARLAAYRAGACSYLAKPVDSSQLFHLLSEVTGRIPADPYRILLVDDDKLMLEIQSGILLKAGMTVQTVSQPVQALEIIQRFKPDVLVLDMYMPEVSGPELAAILRDKEDLVNLPILFLSSEKDVGKQLLALNLGGDDFLVKPVQPDHFVAAVTARARRGRRNISMMQSLKHTLYEREREHLALDRHALVSIADAAGLITYVNDNFCSVSGYHREEFLGKNHRMVQSGLHTAEFYQTMWQTLVCGSIWHGEICNRKKDGGLYWVKTSITPFLDSEGQPYQYVSISTDITAMKESQAALAASEERWSFALEGAGDGVWDWNVMTGEINLSKAGAAMFGYAENEVGNHISDWNEQLLPLDQLRWQDTLRDFFRSKADKLAQEYRVRCKDGSYKWVLTRGMVVSRSPEGKILRMIGVHTDINARKELEEQRSQIQEYLKLQIDRMPIGYILWDQDFRVQTWNPAASTIFGYTREEVLGKHPYELIVPLEAKSLIEDIWDRLLSGDASAHSINENITKDGRTIVCEWTNTPLHGVDGSMTSVLSMVQDITEKKRAELALAESEHQLKEAQAMAHVGNWQANMITGEAIWSDEVYRIFGYQKEDFTPDTRAFFSAVHPDDLPQVLECGSQAELLGYSEVVHRILRPDGSLCYVHQRMQAFKDASGQLKGFSGTVQDITTLKQTENELNKSKERLRRGQFFANIGTWDWNIQTGELHWTERIAPLFGYPIGELDTTYENFIAAIHPDDRQSVINAVNASVNTGAPYEIEHRVVWPDGSVRWLLERGDVVRGADGKPIQMLGVVQDIDDKKRVELALAESRNRLVYAQTLAKLGYWSVDIDTLALSWSEEVYAIFGRDLQTFGLTLADYYHEIVHPDDLESVLRAEQETLSSGGRHNIDHRFIHTDGSIRWVHLEGEAIRDDTGKIISLSGTVQDINDRKRIELVLAEREHQLHEAQKLAHIGNWQADLTSGTLEWSDEIYRIFGREPGSFQPSIGSFKAAVHPEDRKLLEESEVIAAQTGVHDVEHRVVRPDGSIRHVHELAHAERNADGVILRMIGTVQDITERKLTETRLAESYTELQRLSSHLENLKEEEREKIARDLHDEIGSVLVALKMRVAWLASQLSAETSPLSAEIGDIANLVSDAISKMRQVVAQLRPNLQEGFGFAATVEDYVKKFSQQSGLECSLVLPKEELELDSQQSITLFRILQETLNNAVKHAQASRIKIQLTRKENSLSMVIEDNGVGFDPSIRKEQSFGLIGIKERALLIGGEARINSTPNTGTRVSVTIPI